MTEVKIRFNDFVVNENTRELFLQNEPVSIQKKSFDLLLYLIKHKDRAVSKDELLDVLWDGRVVSESVLSHAATKLRLALNDSNGKGNIIRTVYGFGLQFVAEVEQISEIQNKATEPENNPGLMTYSKTILMSVVLLILMLFVAFKAKIFLKKAETEPVPDTSTKINFMAVDANVLDQDIENSWLLNGMTLYLNQLMAVTEKSVPLTYLEDMSSDAKATQNYDIDHVIKTRHENNRLLLSYRDGVNLAEVEIPLEDLKQAITVVNDWICERILVTDTDCQENALTVSNEDTFVIENYLRGQAALMAFEPQKAINFFEVCLQQDSQFHLARLALAEAYLTVSEFTKAISAAQTAAQVSRHPVIAAKAHILEARAYYRQSKFSEAKSALNLVLEDQQTQTALKAVAMMELAQVNRDADDLDSAFKLAQNSKDILEKMDLPLMVARAYEIMGTIKLTSGELKQAEQSLKQSLQLFEQLQHNKGIEKVLSPLGLVMQSQGLLTASLEYGKQRQLIAEKLGDPITIAGTHLHLANLLLEIGDLDLAESHAKQMWDIVITQQEPNAILLAHYIAAEVAYAKNNYRLSLDKFNQALRIAEELEVDWRRLQITCTMGGYATDGGFYEESQAYLEQCEALAKSMDDGLFLAVSSLYFSRLYHLQGQTDKALSVLNQALTRAEPLANDHLYHEIYLEFFYLTIDTDPDLAEQYLFKIPEGYKDDYVYVLSLAEVALIRGEHEKALQLALEAKQKAKENWFEAEQELLDRIQISLAE